jgi:hypothetical protein
MVFRTKLSFSTQANKDNPPRKAAELNCPSRKLSNSTSRYKATQEIATAARWPTVKRKVRNWT